MDLRGEVVQTCILIKSIPFDTDVESIKKAVSDHVVVNRVFRYVENADNNIRFIVQLRTRQDATKLIKANNLTLQSSENEKVKVEVGFCPECIVPSEWMENEPEDSNAEELSVGFGCHSDGMKKETNSDVSETVKADLGTEVLIGQFSTLTVNEKESVDSAESRRDKCVDDLASSKETYNSKPNEEAEKVEEEEDTVVYRRRRQETSKVPSKTMLDLTSYSSPSDTPQADVYGPVGDVYMPMWSLGSNQRPRSAIETNVTTRSTENVQRSLSVFVDGHKSLTEENLSGLSDIKKKEKAFERTVPMVTTRVNKGNDSSDISKMAGDPSLVTSTLPSEHENDAQSKITNLKFQANELESIEKDDLYKCKGEEMEDVVGEDSERCTTRVTDLLVKEEERGVPSIGAETPRVLTTGVIPDGTDWQSPGPEKRISQGRTEYNVGESISTTDSTGSTLGRQESDLVNTLATTGHKSVKPTTETSGEITAESSLPQQRSSPGHLHPEQPFTGQSSQLQHSAESDQHQLSSPHLGLSSPFTSKESQSLASQILLTGEPDQGQKLPSQLGQGQQLTNQVNMDHLQSSRCQQLSSQLDPSLPINSQTALDQPLTAQVDYCQQSTSHMGNDEHHTGMLAQGQHLIGQLNQGQHLIGQLNQGKLVTGQIEHGQHITGQIEKGPQIVGHLDSAQPLTGQQGPTLPLTNQEGFGQQRGDRQSPTPLLLGQSVQGQQPSDQLGESQPFTDQKLGNDEQSNTGHIGPYHYVTGHLGTNQPYTGQLHPTQGISGQQFSNVYGQQMIQQGAILPPQNHQYQRQSGQIMWPVNYPYHYPSNANMNYQPNLGPGYPNYSMPQHVPPGILPHQAPHVTYGMSPHQAPGTAPGMPPYQAPHVAHGMPLYQAPNAAVGMPPHQVPHVASEKPPHQAPVTAPGMSSHQALHMASCEPQEYQPESTASSKISPLTGTGRETTSPALHQPVSTPENIPVVTGATSMTRPLSVIDIFKREMLTDNKCLVPEKVGQKQEVQKGNSISTAKEMEADCIRQLQQWAQSPVKPHSQQEEIISGHTADPRQEHLYDTVLSYQDLHHLKEIMNFGQIKLLEGKLTDVQADVIVNPTNKDLHLASGNVSKRILEAAGEQIQAEGREKYPLGINQRVVGVTAGGKLDCQKIFHVVLPRWDGQAESADKALQQLVTTCLSMLVDLNLFSIAFPALGTGKTGYPADIVAKAMLESTNRFLINREKTVLVNFVIFHGDKANRKAFENIALSVLESNDEEEPMEVDDLEQQEHHSNHPYKQIQDHHGDHTYMNLSSQGCDEHIYESINIKHSEGQPDLLQNIDESPYMKMDFNKPIIGKQATLKDKDGSYINMQQFRKQQSDTETSNMRFRETERARGLQPESKSSEDLPMIPNQRPQFLRVTYPKPLTEDDLKFYFENEKKSGGGEILKIEHNSRKRVTLIQFEDPDVALHVVDRTHKLCGSQLQVTIVTGEIPPTIEEKKLLVCNINPKTTEDTLVNFLEAKVKAVPTDVMYSTRKDRAVVSFDSQPDFDMLQQICKTRPLDGNHLKVSHVPVSSVVLVKDCPSVSKDTILLYFESKKSNGGNVERVEILPDQSECLVHFEDPAVAKRVCDPKHKLLIQKQQVAAILYYPFLRSVESKTLDVESSDEALTETESSGQLQGGRYLLKEHSKNKSPEKRELPDPPLDDTMKSANPVTLRDIESDLTKFIVNSEPNKSAFEKMMSKVKGKVIWPEDLKTDSIQIICLMDMMTDNAAMEAEQWSAEIYRNVKQFFSRMTTEDVPVAKQVWQSVCLELQSLNISHPDGVAVILNPLDHTIVIAGHKKFVNDLKKEIEKIIKMAEESLREGTEQVSKSEVLKMFQIQILWKFKFRDEICKRCPNLEVEIDVDRRKITFTGVLSDVDKGRQYMREKLESIPSESFAISRGMKELFHRMPAKTEFVEQLKQRHLVAVWDIPPHQDICIIFAKSSQVAKNTVSIFTKLLKEKKIPLKEDLEKIVSSTKWQSALRHLFSKYPEKIQINVEKNCVYVTAVSAVFDEVCDSIDAEIRDYKNIHDIHKEFLSVEEGVFSFLEKHRRSEIETCTLALQKTLNLFVKTRNSKDKPGYDLEGTRDAIKLARKKLQDVIDKVSMDTYRVQIVGAADFFHSTEGQDKIRQIESATSSIIRKSSEYDSAEKASSQSLIPVTRATCNIGQGKQCLVLEGDMTKLKVDVMVNAANTDLQHGGGIAGAIAAAGGPVIQNECDDYVTKHGKVPDGEAISSSSGSLPCKMVVHTVGPIWKDGTHNEEKKLQEAVYRSLELAKNYRSVALPAISAGIFGYPLNRAVETIVSMVGYFFKKHSTTKIRNVYLCDTGHHTVKAFIKELVSKYGPQSIKTDYDTGSTSSGETSDEESTDEMSEDEGYTAPRTSSKRKIAVEVVRGELAKTKADVLVNSTGRDLMLNVGMLSKSLLEYGGLTIQKECTKKYTNGILPGDVAITTGGNLACRYVYHGTFDSWGKDQRGCEQTLEKFIKVCLQEADRNRMTSIAFPALGTGRLGYPPANVANIMLQCVRGFERDIPNTYLQSVMFVVYPQDRQSVQDFESVVDEDKFRSGGTAGSNRSSYYRTRPQQLGQVNIELKQGDITMEMTSAIVNSTDDQLDLRKGAVSKAILKAGGPKLQVECNAQRMAMMSQGLVVTSGGNMLCRYILHVRTCSRPKDLAQAVGRCLKEADRLRCDTLTFPALGTGQIGCPPKDVADTMFTTIQQFTDQLRYLKKVSIVIYQADMVDTFKAQLKRQLGGADSQTKEKGAYKFKSKTPKADKSVTCATPAEVQFLLWSDSSTNLNQAKRRIDQACEYEFRTMTVSSSYQEIIKGLNRYQIEKLHQLGSQGNVHLRINQSRGEITLEGRHSLTSALLPEIQNLLHKFEKHKDDVEKAKTVADYVQWLYDENGKWRRFNAEINLVIEKAFKDKEVQTKVKDNKGVTYIIDFQKMEEYEKDLPHKKYKIERRDLGAKSSAGIRLPTSWSPMGKDSYKMVTLSTNDSDYKTTEKAFLSAQQRAPIQQGGFHQFLMQGFMAPQYGRRQIVKIQRIQNEYLYKQYSVKKKELFDKNRKDPEKWLWHGTSPDSIDKIARRGFDRSYCGKNATAYGNGVYFAVDASYSVGFCQPDRNGLNHIFYTRVLTGELCAGHSGMRYLPDGVQGTTYDSATNNVSAPSIYIIFHDSQAYPAYLVSFR